MEVRRAMPISREYVISLAVFTFLAVACGPTRRAAADPEAVQATLLADSDAAVPGREFTLGMRLKMKPHWHTYWVNPGEYGTPTRIKLTGPAGFEFGQVQWPLPTKIDAPGGISYGYEDEVLLMVPVKVSKEVLADKDAALEADVLWLACKEECIPGKAKLKLSLPVRAEAKPANRELFDAWRQRLPGAKDQAPAADTLSKIEQLSGADGSPQPALAVRWKQAPKKVEWFPVSTRAVAIEDVVVRHDGRLTQIQFKPTLFKAAEIPGGRVEGVLVYEDAAGNRRGVVAPVRVALGKEVK
jgi:DsbC/DsbD-like thiol-disulfide interchange protein